MKQTLFFILVLTFLAHCKSESQEKVLDKETFTNLLVEMYLLEGDVSMSTHLDGNVRNKFNARYLELFKKMGTDSTEVRKTFEAFEKDPDELALIMQEARERMNVHLK